MHKVSESDVSITGLGNVAIMGDDGNYAWELGKRGELYGFYKHLKDGSIMWWPVWFENLEEATGMLRYVARIYNFKLVSRNLVTN